MDHGNGKVIGNCQLTKQPAGPLGVEHKGVDGDVLLVDGSPLMEANFVVGVEHPDFSTDSAAHEDVGAFAFKDHRRPGKSVEIFSATEGKKQH